MVQQLLYHAFELATNDSPSPQTTANPESLDTVIAAIAGPLLTATVILVTLYVYKQRR